LSTDGAFKQMDLMFVAVENALEIGAVADGQLTGNVLRLRTRSNSSSKQGFEVGRSHLFIKVKIGTRRCADLEQLAGLGLDPLPHR